MTPEADDAAKRLAEILVEHGVRGVFKLVGEKLRVIEKRGRQDVISALAKNEIGYHSEFHSKHPVISEYLKDLDWDEGVRECEGRERKGVEDIRRVFRVNPSCYGQPGGAWVPQIYGALLEWGIPVYLDETAFIGLDERPFWYCGVLNVLNLGRNVISVNFELGTPGFLEGVCKRFKDMCERLQSEGGGVISIFNHPCTLVTEEFWDGVNFSNGRNPAGDLMRPRMKSNDAIEAGYRDFSDFVHYVASFPSVKVITARDALDLYPDPSDGKIVSKGEVLNIFALTHEGMTFYKSGEIALSPAEIFWLAVSCLRGFVIESRMPDEVRARRVLGPTEEFSYGGGSESINWKDFAESCVQVASYIEDNGKMPSRIEVGKLILSPAVYLKTAISAISYMAREGRAPSSLAVQNGTLESSEYISEEGALDAWKWVIFPLGFTAPRLVNIARLQAWTLKPAIPRGSR